MRSFAGITAAPLRPATATSFFLTMNRPRLLARHHLPALALGLTLTASSLFANDWFDSRSRERLVNLRGTWRFSVGDDARWAKPDYDDSDWSRVEVPSYWEDEGYDGYNGFAWYRRTFKFHDDAGQSTYLLLGKVDDADEVFVNGKKIGGTGGMPPNYVTAYNRDRVYAIPPKLLREGHDNLVAVRVYDAAMGGGIQGGSVGIYTSRIPMPDIDLTGDWKFHAGDNMAWKEERADESEFVTIGVPSYWENAGHDVDGFAWYRKTFTAPANLKDHTMVLMLGKIDDTDEVYLNGEKIGNSGNLNNSDRHSGASYHDQNRGYYFPASLLKETNVVAVRVHDHGERGGIYEGPVGIIGQNRYIEYWESVRGVPNSAASFLRWLARDEQ